MSGRAARQNRISRISIPLSIAGLTANQRKEKRIEIHTERYRSGHNGTDSKSVVPHGTVGSNPTRSAKNPECESVRDFYFLLFASSLLPRPKCLTGFLAGNKQQWVVKSVDESSDLLLKLKTWSFIARLRLRLRLRLRRFEVISQTAKISVLQPLAASSLWSQDRSGLCCILKTPP